MGKCVTECIGSDMDFKSCSMASFSDHGQTSWPATLHKHSAYWAHDFLEINPYDSALNTAYDLDWMAIVCFLPGASCTLTGQRIETHS